MLGALRSMRKLWRRVAEYFFDKEHGFFFDRRLKDGSFVREPGCEAYTPLWTEATHTHEQFPDMLPVLRDTAKFSYIRYHCCRSSEIRSERILEAHLARSDLFRHTWASQLRL